MSTQTQVLALLSVYVYNIWLDFYSIE